MIACANNTELAKEFMIATKLQKAAQPHIDECLKNNEKYKVQSYGKTIHVTSEMLIDDTDRRRKLTASCANCGGTHLLEWGYIDWHCTDCGHIGADIKTGYIVIMTIILILISLFIYALSS